jgi:hypothetical protein
MPSRGVAVVVSSIAGLAGACGSAGDGGPVTATIHVHTGDPPALFAFRDGASAPWQTPAATAPGQYEIGVHGPYTVAAVCVSGESAATRERSLTPEDPTDVDLSCLLAPPSPDSHVTGTTVNLPFGHVEIGHAIGSVTTAAPGFDIVVPDGTYDVIARADSGDAAMDRIAFRRHVVVAGPTLVTPAIDVAAEGTPSLAVTPAVTNLGPGETLALLGELTAGATSSNVEFPNLGVVHVLPDAALLASDVQSILVAAIVGTATRSVKRRYHQGASTQFTLPPALVAQLVVTGDQLALQWSSLPPTDVLQLEHRQQTADGNGSVMQSRELSAHYLAATGATRAALDTDLPGYAAAWRVDVTRSSGRLGGTTRTEPGGDELFTSISENLTPLQGGPARIEPGSPRAAWRQHAR